MTASTTTGPASTPLAASPVANPVASSDAAAPAAGVDPRRAGVPWAALVHSEKSKSQSKLKKKLTRTMMKTIDRWNLVEAGDHIMVAVSGGKDSYAMLDLLWEAQKKAPFSFSITAVHLDQAQPGYDGTSLQGWLQASGVPFQIVREDTYSIVKAGTKEGQAYCFLCARLRRGILYSIAERLGCNKIALGHHRDDALETLLMNLCYAGKLQAMPARYTTDDGKFVVMRPLIDCAESDLRDFAVERAYPILPCNLCGSQDGLQRDAMAALLTQLEGKIPDVRAVMHHAISNVRPTHLLDVELAEAWEQRPESLKDARTVQPGDPGPRRLTGAVVAEHAGDVVTDAAAAPVTRRALGSLRILNEDATEGGP